MTYAETIEHLYSQLPMFSRIGAAAYKEGLHTTIALCKALDDPQHKFKSIHIAGTNGKGSTSHMLAAILQQSGYKTGLYTSPHLKDFRERIKVNGEMIAEDFIVDFVERTQAISDLLKPSFFELTVAMAFEYFAQEKVDIAVIETGLGGRLDSTNVIIPLLSVITNIGYDHMNLLGDTLEKIAFEKAGIIKPGIPVVIGEFLAETKSIFTKTAETNNAPIYFAQDEYEVIATEYSSDHMDCTIRSISDDIIEEFKLDLNGLYQANNLRTVLAAEGILMRQGFEINDDAEKTALSNTKKLTGLYGRWDVIAKEPTIVLDVAHNEDGIKKILEQLSRLFDQQIPVQFHFVIGMVNDKDIRKVLSLLPPSGKYYFTNAHIPRALPFLQLREMAAAFGLNGEGFDNVNDAILKARATADKTDIIVVCGSVFVVGEVERDEFYI